MLNHIIKIVIISLMTQMVACNKNESSGSAIVDQHDCTAEVMKHEDAVVARCPDMECIQREVKKLMDKCAEKKGY